MFRTLIYPSPGACDYSVELPHWSYCSWFDVCWRFGVVGLEWYSCCRLKPATITIMHGPINIRKKTILQSYIKFLVKTKNILCIKYASIISSVCLLLYRTKGFTSDTKNVQYFNEKETHIGPCLGRKVRQRQVTTSQLCRKPNLKKKFIYANQIKSATTAFAKDQKSPITTQAIGLSSRNKQTVPHLGLLC